MKRSIVAVLAAAAITLIPSIAASQKTPDVIGIVEGPAQPNHRLTIVSAFSCGYCRAFDTKAMAELRGTWSRKGLQIESVPVSISPTDIPAAIAAACGDPRQYARRSTILFRAQPDIAGNWNGADDAAKARATAKPKGTSAPDIARLAGIMSLASSLGLTTGQLQACIGDPVRQARQVRREKLVDAKWHVVGTPTIFLDGRPVGSGWETVRAALVKAYG